MTVDPAARTNGSASASGNPEHPAKSRERANVHAGDELELDSKKLQVEDKIYYVDMKENKNGRFIKLGHGYGGMSRIIVPMPIAASFIANVKECSEFNDSHPKAPSEPKPAPEGDEKNEEFPPILHSSKLFIQNRRFYFDLREHKDGYRRLKISYALKSRRIVLSIVSDALPSLIAVMEDYVHRYSEEPSTAASPANATHAKDEPVENTGAPAKGRRKRLSARVGDANAARVAKPKKAALAVSEKPAPVKQPVVNKVYQLEVVTGELNAFMRMTEMIGNSKKSTFHVPLEGCAAFKDAIVKFVNQVTPEAIANASALRLAAEAANLSLQAQTNAEKTT